MTHQLELTDIKRAWIDDCAPRLALILPQLGEFTSDDLHRILPSPEHPNWYGVLLAKLKCAGLVECVGYRPSARKERNGGVLRVWRASVIRS